jgi:hypothetical protein
VTIAGAAAFNGGRRRLKHLQAPFELFSRARRRTACASLRQRGVQSSLAACRPPFFADLSRQGPSSASVSFMYNAGLKPGSSKTGETSETRQHTLSGEDAGLGRS